MTFPGGSLYHATKWGIEGFMEAVSQELAPFNIGVTIVEPGSTATDFGRNLVVAEPHAAYAQGPVGGVRAFFGKGDYVSPGDAVKTAQAIIATVEHSEPPLRLVTGSDAFRAIHAALTTRLRVLEEQREVARSTDRT